MAPSPHKVESLALARDTLTNLDLIRQWSPDQRRQIVGLAQSILRTDRAARLDLGAAQPAGPGRVVRVPLAVFQNGPARRRRSRHANPFTPGDAA
jgi:hypothetical protein